MPTSRRLYGNAVDQIADRLTESRKLLLEASKAMVDERPGEAQTLLEQAEMTISGAATLAKWATTLVKEAR
jgi:hypothetical protein